MIKTTVAVWSAINPRKKAIANDDPPWLIVNPETFYREGAMSLFSDIDHKNPAPTPEITACVEYSGTSPAMPKLLFLGTILGMLLIFTAISIFVVLLHPVPSFPGTRTGDNHNIPRFVQALDALQKTSSYKLIADKLLIGRGDYYDPNQKSQI